MNEYLLIAEDSLGSVVEKRWVSGATLKEARKAFWDSLTVDQRNVVASVEDVETKVGSGAGTVTRR